MTKGLPSKRGNPDRIFKAGVSLKELCSLAKGRALYGLCMSVDIPRIKYVNTYQPLSARNCHRLNSHLVYKGFGLKVTKAGRKVFLVQYRLGGRGAKTRRMTIGTYGTLSVEQARSAAKSILRDVTLGIDPMAEKDALKNDKSFGELIDVFLKDHAKTKLKHRSAIEYERLIRTLVPAPLLKQRIEHDHNICITIERVSRFNFYNSIFRPS